MIDKIKELNKKHKVGSKVKLKIGEKVFNTTTTTSFYSSNDKKIVAKLKGYDKEFEVEEFNFIL